MSLEKRKARVGAFIIGAITLLVVGILALGGLKYFAGESAFHLYFTNSISGLNVGSPVLLRGVTMGSVTRIALVGSANNDDITTVVSIQFNKDGFYLPSGKTVQDENEEQELMREMVSKGLRAQLQTASLVTGQSCIMLDFFPETTAEFHSSDPLTEVPTIKSPIQTLSQTFRKVPIEKIANDLQLSIHQLNEILLSGRIENTLKAVEDTFTTMNTLLKGFEKAPALTERILTNVAEGTRDTPQMMADLRKSVADFSKTMNEVQAVVANAKNMVDPNSSLATQLNNLVRDGAAASRALRHFADTLDRNPESILQGRKGAY